jgi:DNA-binding HxlR family transcriptional regulator
MPPELSRRTKYSRTGYLSPIDATLEVIGGKYKVALLYHLRCGVRRYGELRRLLPQATPRVLTQQLRELERDGLISRVEVARKPLRVDYGLSPQGRTLQPLLDALCAWGLGRIARLPKAAQSV